MSRGMDVTGSAVLTPQAGAGFSRGSRSVPWGSSGVRALWLSCGENAQFTLFTETRLCFRLEALAFSLHFTNQKTQETGIWDF